MTVGFIRVEKHFISQLSIGFHKSLVKQSGTDRWVVTNVKCLLKTTGSLASLPTCSVRKTWLAHLECDRQKVRLITFQVWFLRGPPFSKCFFFALFPRWMCEMYPTDLGGIPSGVSGYIFRRHKKKKNPLQLGIPKLYSGFLFSKGKHWHNQNCYRSNFWPSVTVSLSFIWHTLGKHGASGHTD